MGEPEREEEKRRRRGGYLDDERGVVVSPSDRSAFSLFLVGMEGLMCFSFLGRGY